jgi:hypothetical protein
MKNDPKVVTSVLLPAFEGLVQNLCLYDAELGFILVTFNHFTIKACTFFIDFVLENRK